VSAIGSFLPYFLYTIVELAGAACVRNVRNIVSLYLTEDGIILLEYAMLAFEIIWIYVLKKKKNWNPKI